MCPNTVVTAVLAACVVREFRQELTATARPAKTRLAWSACADRLRCFVQQPPVDDMLSAKCAIGMRAGPKQKECTLCGTPSAPSVLHGSPNMSATHHHAVVPDTLAAVCRAWYSTRCDPRQSASPPPSPPWTPLTSLTGPSMAPLPVKLRATTPTASCGACPGCSMYVDY